MFDRGSVIAVLAVAVAMTACSSDDGSGVTAVTAFPEPVALEGSAEDVITDRQDLSNIAGAIADWIADDPGREGVLRHGRGVTLFLPNNDGFSAEDAAAVVSDFDQFTVFISEHLKIGIVKSDEFGDSISTAMGVSYPIVEGTIGGRLIVETDIEATNGFIHIIDGPLVPID